MIINHPYLGPREAAEFTILGDAKLLNRPDWQANNADEAFYSYQYLRENPAGVHRELWFHEQGDRSWLVVTRDTVTHAVINVALASDVALLSRGPKASKSANRAKALRAEKTESVKKPVQKKSIKPHNTEG